MSENNSEFGKIIAKAWRDPAFKAELIADPSAALRAEGIEVPAGMTVTVLENTDKHFHLVLPPKPSGELSENDLEAMAGGYCRAASIDVRGWTKGRIAAWVFAGKIKYPNADGFAVIPRLPQ